MDPITEKTFELSEDELADVTGGTKRQDKKKTKPSGNGKGTGPYLTIKLTNVLVSS